jgi:hypothetical protein
MVVTDHWKFKTTHKCKPIVGNVFDYADIVRIGFEHNPSVGVRDSDIGVNDVLNIYSGVG